MAETKQESGKASGQETASKVGSTVTTAGVATGNPYVIAAGLAIQAGSALYGMLKGGKKGSLEDEKKKQAIIDALEAPNAADLRVKLEALQNMGALTPEIMQEINQGRSELETVKLDPRLQQAQTEALAGLQRRGMEGLTLDEKAEQLGLEQQAQAASRRDQEAVLANMQARGQLGGGAELAARMQAGQMAAEQQAAGQRELARAVATRRLEAQLQAGNMAGNIQGQDYQRLAARAASQNLINQFNTAGARDVQAGNVDARNIANRYNLDYKKDLEANRVATINAQRQGDVQAYKDAMEARNRNREIALGHLNKSGSIRDQASAERAEGLQKIGTSILGAASAYYGGGGGKQT